MVDIFIKHVYVEKVYLTFGPQSQLRSQQCAN